MNEQTGFIRMNVPVLISSYSGCNGLCEGVIIEGKVTIIYDSIELVEGACARVLSRSLSR